MYDCNMSLKARAKPRLTQQDWIDAALEVLAQSGIGSVTIETLASTLGITRGSFYHHFSDRQELLEAMLEYWAKEWTFSVRDQVASLGLDPGNTLLALLRTIRNNRASDLDAPMRAWALHDETAKTVLARVDEARLAMIRKQFVALGFEELDAENRARLLLYYEMAAPAMFDRLSPEDRERLLVERHRFLITARVGKDGPE
jgi:AcrR family transcriptional regulator